MVNDNGLLDEFMVLDNDRTVRKPLYDEVKAYVSGAIDVLYKIRYQGTFIVEDLYDKAEWKNKPHGERRDLGRLVAYMVKQGMLPIEYVGCEHKSPNEYRIKYPD